MARERHVTYVRTPNDVLAHQITRLTGGEVVLDEIEQLLIALQRRASFASRDGAAPGALPARSQERRRPRGQSALSY